MVIRYKKQSIIEFSKILLTATLTFTACRNGYKSHTIKSSNRVETSENNTNQFQLKLLVGTKYYCTTTIKTTSELEVENKDIKNINNTTMGLIYQVLQAGADSMVVKVTYDKLHIELTNDGEKQVMDAGNAGDEQTPLDKLLADIKGSSITVTLNKKGKVLSATGSKEIIDKVVAGLYVYDDAETKKAVQTQIGKLVGNQFIESVVGQGFNFYPDSAIAAGKSWSKKTSIDEEIKVDASTTYTLSSIDDGIASIDVESLLESSGSKKPLNIMGQQVLADLSQKASGSLEADMATGMLIQGKTKSKIKGTIELMNRVVPIEINSEKVISIKKI